MRYAILLALLSAIVVPGAASHADDPVIFIEVGDFRLQMEGYKLEATIFGENGDIPLLTEYKVDESGTVEFSARLSGENDPLVEGKVEEGVADGWLTQIDSGAAHTGAPFNWEMLSDGINVMGGCKCSSVAGAICVRKDCQGTPKDCSNGGVSATCQWNELEGAIENYKIFGSEF